MARSTHELVCASFHHLHAILFPHLSILVPPSTNNIWIRRFLVKQPNMNLVGEASYAVSTSIFRVRELDAHRCPNEHRSFSPKRCLCTICEGSDYSHDIFSNLLQRFCRNSGRNMAARHSYFSLSTTSNEIVHVQRLGCDSAFLNHHSCLRQTAALHLSQEILLRSGHRPECIFCRADYCCHGSPGCGRRAHLYARSCCHNATIDHLAPLSLCVCHMSTMHCIATKRLLLVIRVRSLIRERDV
mmetsp:Transcript_46621/g.108659  ORF Transcript_46621/g.108659 Transcript_46621/m.108659 type:complete len:243 (-) Transcript_46621:2085-2813(-)